MMTVKCIQKWNVIYIQNGACSLPKRVDKWRFYKYLLTRQQMVFHLFFALTVSIRSWVLFPTLCGYINTKSMENTMSLLWNNMTYIQNTHRFGDFKLTAEELSYEIDVWFQAKFLTNHARLNLKPSLLGHVCLVGSLFQGSYTAIFITYS
jgi:hypothetical protein